MPEPLNGILETALYVDDLDNAAAFYGGILGLELTVRHDPRHVFYRCGQTVVLLFRAVETLKPASANSLPVPSHGASGPGHLCFGVNAADLEDWARHLQDAGISIEADFLWPNGARSIYVRDPAGNSIEFAEPKLWGFAS